jgi:hypothetical protein
MVAVTGLILVQFRSEIRDLIRIAECFAGRMKNVPIRDPMATEGKKRLHDFLKGSFAPSELLMFLKLQGFTEVAAAVDRNIGGTEYFFDVIEALDRRGEIDRHFFDCLTKERPRKAADIEELEALWLDEDRAG